MVSTGKLFEICKPSLTSTRKTKVKKIIAKENDSNYGGMALAFA